MQRFTTRPELVGTFGAAASTHWIASSVGFGVLEKGGNAFDAAVAMGFVLQVVEPHLNGPGGECRRSFTRSRPDGPRCFCRVLRLTLLAPEIVEAVLDGRQPEGATLVDTDEGVPG